MNDIGSTRPTSWRDSASPAERESGEPSGNHPVRGRRRHLHPGRIADHHPERDHRQRPRRLRREALLRRRHLRPRVQRAAVPRRGPSFPRTPSAPTKPILRTARTPFPREPSAAASTWATTPPPPFLRTSSATTPSAGDEDKLNQSASGGGIAVFTVGATPAVITQNLIQSNFAGIRGGGIVAGELASDTSILPSTFTADSNLFWYNSAGFGGAVAAGVTTGAFRSNTIHENTASDLGGAFYLDAPSSSASQAKLVNNVIAGNIGENTHRRLRGRPVHPERQPHRAVQRHLGKHVQQHRRDAAEQRLHRSQRQHLRGPAVHQHGSAVHAEPQAPNHQFPLRHRRQRRSAFVRSGQCSADPGRQRRRDGADRPGRL